MGAEKQSWRNGGLQNCPQKVFTAAVGALHIMADVVAVDELGCFL